MHSAATPGHGRGVSSRTELELERFLPYVMNQLADQISTGLSHIYAHEFGLGIPEWRIIANLAQTRVLNARQIVDRTGMEKSRVSRAVRRLTDRNLVVGRRKDSDNRAVDLALTADGEALYRQLVPRVLDWEQGLLDCLSAAEYRDLMHLLTRLQRRVCHISSA